jgi:hypothetical protein
MQLAGFRVSICSSAQAKEVTHGSAGATLLQNIGEEEAAWSRPKQVRRSPKNVTSIEVHRPSKALTFASTGGCSECVARNPPGWG